MKSHGLGLAEGTALYAGAVLGPGVLALPSLAARAAGPASLIAWGALLLLSVPSAFAFAALGARFPDGGGIASFVARAFGRRPAGAVGWWFYCALPIGVLPAALIGGEYVASALGLGSGAAQGIAATLMLVAFAANYIGLRVSGQVQLILACLLVLLLAIAVGVSAPRARAANFHPFAPHGWWSVGSAASVLFFAFVGWEAASSLSAEFRNPRHIVAATALTLGIVGALYLALATTVIGVLGAGAADSDVPLALLLDRGFGRATRVATAAAAVFLTFGAINSYIAAGARLGAALARDGAMPRALAKGGGVGEVPRRSLSVIAVCCGFFLVVNVFWHLDLGTMMRATSACLAAVTAAGMFAAVKLLPRMRYVSIAGSVFTLVVLAFCGVLLVIPAVLALAADAFSHLRDRLHPRTGFGLPPADSPMTMHLVRCRK
jgi:amino acid efflux transporter